MNTPKRILLFCSDLDGTLIGNAEATRRFRAAWEALSPDARPLLVYSSGRLLSDLRRFVDEGLLPPGDYWIGGVGTEVFDVRANRVLEEFGSYLGTEWKLDAVREVVARTHGVRAQPAEFQTPFKSSWYWDNASAEQIRELKRQLIEAGVAARVVYSSSRDLDVIPRNATKGGSLEWLTRRLTVPLDQVLVAGDTGNDASMFRLPGVRGIIVENAFPELYEATVDIPIFSSRRILADGVLDGLCHFGVICAVPSKHETSQRREDMAPGFQMLFEGTKLGSLTADERSYVRTAYGKALDALRRNITPLGFSACSLKDNRVTGTDVNYRSVWARDGAITVWSTLRIDDPEIRAAQVRTQQFHAAIVHSARVPAQELP
ncbi:MAG TPA: HAD-IIB family hydrolase, partial [Acidobacteriota bacterium]|nr:HAD-IIB family hydrolase [Acidobacteriota bacterium]